MKNSTLLSKATKLHNESEVILDSFRSFLTELLDDECAHLSFSTDGLVVVYGGGHNNSAMSLIDIDSFFKLTSKEEALIVLDNAAI